MIKELGDEGIEERMQSAVQVGTGVRCVRAGVFAGMLE
jgi:hypothetical protein